MVRADRQLALERSQRLGHMTGASWFFVALARHAREHGGGELLRWDGEGEASDYLYARSRELGPHPDGLGVRAQDGTDIAFLLEYDTGTEHLPHLVGKLTGYAEQAGTSDSPASRPPRTERHRLGRRHRKHAVKQTARERRQKTLPRPGRWAGVTRAGPQSVGCGAGGRFICT